MEKKQERRGLGRGLSALMADVAPLRPDDAAASPRDDFMVPVESVFPNPHQPRRDFAHDALRDLSESIRQKGIIQPLIVRPAATGGTYEIVAGERRWRAAQLAELHEVPVILRNYSDSEVLEVAIIENIQRADLNPIEEALAYRQLIEKYGHTQEKLAEALSRSRPHVANLLRLLALPDDVQNMLRAGTLTAGHARALISTTDPTALALKVVGRGLSVRETERLARASAVDPKKRRSLAARGGKDADTKALEADLSSNLKMLVRIDHEPGGDAGQITIRYRTLDQLDLLCEVLSKTSIDLSDFRG